MWRHSFNVNRKTFCFGPLHKLRRNFSRIKHRSYRSVFLILYVLGKKQNIYTTLLLNNSVPCIISGEIAFGKQTNMLNFINSINFDAVLFRTWKLDVKWSRNDCHSNWGQAVKAVEYQTLWNICYCSISSWGDSGDSFHLIKTLIKLSEQQKKLKKRTRGIFCFE